MSWFGSITVIVPASCDDSDDSDGDDSDGDDGDGDGDDGDGDDGNDDDDGLCDFSGSAYSTLARDVSSRTELDDDVDAVVLAARRR